MIAVVLALLMPAYQEREAVLIDPAAVTARPDLVGRRIALDGRVSYFQLHPGRGFDELFFKETEASFQLTPRLRYEKPPKERVARVEGVLRKVGSKFVVNVDRIRLLPNDLTRLQSGLKAVDPADESGREGWKRWAAHRAEVYDDEELRKIVRRMEVEDVAAKAESPEALVPEAALELARRARRSEAPEPIASALAHRAFRTMADAAKSPQAIDRIIAQVKAFLPAAAGPQSSVPATSLARYDADPFDAYRQAPPAVRTALDRELAADLIERSLRLRAQLEPKSGVVLAEEARRDLPDRPEVAVELRDLGLGAAEADVASMRRPALVALAESFRQGGQPDRARELLRSWLVDRREHELIRGDVDGRLALARDYQELLDDRATAVELLREADALNANSRAVADAFRRLGFRRDGKGWVEGSEAFSPTLGVPEEGADDPILGLNPDEVLASLGTPDYRSQVVTQDRLTLQWAYVGTGGTTQYVNFVQQPGYPPRVVSRFSSR